MEFGFKIVLAGLIAEVKVNLAEVDLAEVNLAEVNRRGVGNRQ